MPTAPLHPCAQPGCPELVPQGRCKVHAVQQEHQRTNWQARRWYRRTAWQWKREQVMVEQRYTCAVCHVITTKLEVDHITKHGGDYAKFHERKGLQGLCSTCHAQKTARGE